MLFTILHTDAVWHQIADCPAIQSTCTTLNGQLLTVGGKEKQIYSANIHAYNPVSNSWEVISRMSTPRGHPVVAVLPGSKLMVVSGWISDIRYIPISWVSLVLPEYDDWINRCLGMNHYYCSYLCIVGTVFPVHDVLASLNSTHQCKVMSKFVS